MGVDNHGCSERDRSRRSGISRREFLSGSLLAVGGCSQFVTSQTIGAFRDSDDADGGVQVATLNTAVQDQSGFWDGVRFLISYQVQMEDGYDGIEVTVENTSEGASETHSRNPGDGQEGVIPHEAGRDQRNDSFEFTFEVSASGSDVSNPVLSDRITDTADGESPPGDDMGESDDPVLEQISVVDQSTEANGSQYEVSYQSSNAENFDGEIRVRFDNSFTFFGIEYPGISQTITNQSVTSGTVSYPDDGSTYPRVGTFDITVGIVNDNGIVVDSMSVSDDPDGEDPSTDA